MTEPGAFALLLAPHLLCDGHLEHAVRRAAGRERPELPPSAKFVGQQWLWFNIATMVSAFVGGELVERLSPTSAVQAAAGIAAVAPVAVVLATLFLLDERETHDQSGRKCGARLQSIKRR